MSHKVIKKEELDQYLFEILNYNPKTGEKYVDITALHQADVNAKNIDDSGEGVSQPSIYVATRVSNAFLSEKVLKSILQSDLTTREAAVLVKNKDFFQLIDSGDNDLKALFKRFCQQHIKSLQGVGKEYVDKLHSGLKRYKHIPAAPKKLYSLAELGLDVHKHEYVKVLMKDYIMKAHEAFLKGQRLPVSEFKMKDFAYTLEVCDDATQRAFLQLAAAVETWPERFGNPNFFKKIGQYIVKTPAVNQRFRVKTTKAEMFNQCCKNYSELKDLVRNPDAVIQRYITQCIGDLEKGKILAKPSGHISEYFATAVAKWCTPEARKAFFNLTLLEYTHPKQFTQVTDLFAESRKTIYKASGLMLKVRQGVSQTIDKVSMKLLTKFAKPSVNTALKTTIKVNSAKASAMHYISWGMKLLGFVCDLLEQGDDTDMIAAQRAGNPVRRVIMESYANFEDIREKVHMFCCERLFILLIIFYEQNYGKETNYHAIEDLSLSCFANRARQETKDFYNKIVGELYEDIQKGKVFKQKIGAEQQVVNYFTFERKTRIYLELDAFWENIRREQVYGEMLGNNANSSIIATYIRRTIKGLRAYVPLLELYYGQIMFTLRHEELMKENSRKFTPLIEQYQMYLNNQFISIDEILENNHEMGSSASNPFSVIYGIGN